METKNRKEEWILSFPSVADEHCGGYRDKFELLDMTIDKSLLLVVEKKQKFWEGAS